MWLWEINGHWLLKLETRRIYGFEMREIGESHMPLAHPYRFRLTNIFILQYNCLTVMLMLQSYWQLQTKKKPSMKIYIYQIICPILCCMSSLYMCIHIRIVILAFIYMYIYVYTTWKWTIRVQFYKIYIRIVGDFVVTYGKIFSILFYFIKILC